MESEMIRDGRGHVDEVDKAYHDTDTLSNSTNNQKISPEWWTSDGPHCIHGVDEEEFTLGLQMKCKICEENQSSMKGSTKTNVVFSSSHRNYFMTLLSDMCTPPLLVCTRSTNMSILAF